MVADTNIYISTFAFGGRIGKILEFAQDGRFELYISQPIIAEVKKVFIKKFKWPKSQLAAVIENILYSTTVVEPKQRLSVITADPSDNMILECAVAAYAQIIVSGDKHLLGLNHFQGIKIIKPRNFLDGL